MKTFSLSACLAAVLICCGCSRDQYLADRDRLILHTAVSHFASRSDIEWINPQGVILIEPIMYFERGPGKPYQYLLRNDFVKKEVDLKLINDFIGRNSRSVSFAGMRATHQYRMISVAENDLLAAGTPPSDFKKGITLFLPGLSADGQRAYVLIDLHERHGSVAHYLLTNHRGQWKVEASSLESH